MQTLEIVLSIVWLVLGIYTLTRDTIKKNIYCVTWLLLMSYLVLDIFTEGI